MEEKIKEYLSDLEKEKGIKILLACETGSRAWGFPSPDSDFDVRMIYKHQKDWYLNLRSCFMHFAHRLPACGFLKRKRFRQLSLGKC